MLIYLLPAVITSAFCFHAVSQDNEASIYDAGTLGFILLAALLWPVTLPSILYKKFQKFRSKGSYFNKHRQLFTDDRKAS